MWWPTTPCGQDGGWAGHPSFFIFVFKFLLFCFLFIFKSKYNKILLFFNMPRGGLRDPSHQPAPFQSILDWRGAGSLLVSVGCFLGV
jgi:hypothetical protein